MIVFDQKQSFFYSNKISDQQFFSGFGTKNTDCSQIIKSVLPISAWQTHSTNIKFVTAPEANIKNVDGFITKTKNILLIVKTADCVPIIFADKKNRVVGISHQGWKGTLEQMAEKMVNEMLRYGAEKKELLVAMGPAICKNHYQVSADLYLKFAQKFHLQEDSQDLDLKQINFQQLLAAGLDQKQIEICSYCSYCDNKLFYSYRRDGKNKLGKMISFITLRG